MKQMIGAFLAVLVFFGGVGLCGTIEHNYTRKDCEVVEVCGSHVTVEDKCGYLWSFDDYGYRVGDTVTLHMHTNYTHGTINDDYIVDVRG